jgi:hypothetical protein
MLVDVSGNIELQMMLYISTTFKLYPMDTIRSSVFTENMQFTYIHPSKALLVSEGTKVHLLLDKTYCGNPFVLNTD